MHNLAERIKGPRGTFFEYQDRPVDFTAEVLGVDLWGRQAEVLGALACHRRVAVRSGHKVGKSKLAASASVWWLYTRADARVVLLAPSARQVRSILWREVKRLHAKSPIELEGTPYDMPDRGLQLQDGREIVGFSTDISENLAGFSGQNMLFVIDEASGFDENLFDVILGNLAGGGSVLMIGNPTRASGTFYAAFHERSALWDLHHISSEETPNAVSGKVLIPGLATRDWIDEMQIEWGADSPLYQVRVKGDFPTAAINTVIPLELVDAAVRRWNEWKQSEIHDDTQTLRIGVDPARFGDDESVVAAVRGNVLVGLHVFRGIDTMSLVERVREIADAFRNSHETPEIRVDEIGIGAGVVDALKLHPRISVSGINAAGSSSVAQYERKRDEIWFSLRDWLRSGGMIPDDNKLHADLVSPTFSYTTRNRYKVEGKDEIKARLKRSPDRADALGVAIVSNRSAPELDGFGIGLRRI